MWVVTFESLPSSVRWRVTDPQRLNDRYAALAHTWWQNNLRQLLLTTGCWWHCATGPGAKGFPQVGATRNRGQPLTCDKISAKRPPATPELCWTEKIYRKKCAEFKDIIHLWKFHIYNVNINFQISLPNTRLKQITLILGRDEDSGSNRLLFDRLACVQLYSLHAFNHTVIMQSSTQDATVRYTVRARYFSVR